MKHFSSLQTIALILILYICGSCEPVWALSCGRVFTNSTVSATIPAQLKQLLMQQTPEVQSAVKSHPRWSEFLNLSAVSERVPVLRRHEFKKILSESEREAVEIYQNGNDYLTFNTAFRTQNLKECPQCNLLAKALDRMPPFEGVVFRGSDFSPQLGMDPGFVREGAIVQDLAPMSSTRSFESAYWVPETGVLMVIRSRKGRAIYNNAAEDFVNEYEVLFPPKTQFEVMMVVPREDGSRIVFLNELG